MAKRLKTITAGRLVVVGCYTIPTPRSTEQDRKALREISSAAQMTINANRSWQRLELLLAANFGRRYSTWCSPMTTSTCRPTGRRR